MGSFKKNKIAILVVLIVLFFVYWLVSVIHANWGEDEIAINTFNTLSDKTPYTLVMDEDVTKGTMGNFYHCLKEYRNIFHMRTKEGKQGRGKLIISDNAFLKFLTIDGEIYRFHIVYAEEGLKKWDEKMTKAIVSSDSYAINCDLSLLNRTKLDKGSEP